MKSLLLILKTAVLFNRKDAWFLSHDVALMLTAYYVHSILEYFFLEQMKAQRGNVKHGDGNPNHFT